MTPEVERLIADARVALGEEFSVGVVLEDEHVAVVSAVNKGRTFIRTAFSDGVWRGGWEGPFRSKSRIKLAADRAYQLTNQELPI